MIPFLVGKKTYIIAAAAILYAVFGVISKNLDVNSAINIILAALGTMGLRSAIATPKA
jgi:hypothetical protein